MKEDEQMCFMCGKSVDKVNKLVKGRYASHDRRGSAATDCSAECGILQSS